MLERTFDCWTIKDSGLISEDITVNLTVNPAGEVDVKLSVEYSALLHNTLTIELCQVHALVVEHHGVVGYTDPVDSGL
jgi:hypothetical protein